MSLTTQPDASDLAAALRPLLPWLPPFWLDSGALLGLVRSGALMEWDNDIDLGMWDQHTDAMVDAVAALRQAGFKVTSRSYRGRTYGFSIKDQAKSFRPVHIHIYYRQGETAWSPQTIAYAPVTRANALAGFRGPAGVRNTLLAIKHRALERGQGGAAQRLLRSTVFYPLWGAVVLLRNRIERQHWSSVMPLSTIYATYTWVIPARFFDALKTVSVSGVDIQMPEDAEAYLALRYGAWRQPVSDWCFWTDDGGIVPQAPEQALALAAH